MIGRPARHQVGDVRPARAARPPGENARSPRRSDSTGRRAEAAAPRRAAAAPWPARSPTSSPACGAIRACAGPARRPPTTRPDRPGNRKSPAAGGTAWPSPSGRSSRSAGCGSGRSYSRLERVAEVQPLGDAHETAERIGPVTRRAEQRQVAGLGELGHQLVRPLPHPAPVDKRRIDDDPFAVAVSRKTWFKRWASARRSSPRRTRRRRFISKTITETLPTLVADKCDEVLPVQR